MQTVKEKRLDFEVLRLNAIFGVVFNHTQERGFELYMADGVGTVNFVGSLLLSILCKAAVPLFFLISGGLLLHREEPIRTVLTRRVLRIALALVLFSGVLYLFWMRWGYVSGSAADFLKRLWSSGVSQPYWYLYAYLGLMLMLPLLRPMVKAMSDMAFVYLAAVHVLLSVALAAARGAGLGPVHPDLLIPAAEPCLFYFILGYYLTHRFSWDLVKKRHLAILWALALISVAVLFELAELDVGRGDTVYLTQRGILGYPFFLILAVYVSVHQWLRGRTLPGWLSKGITTLGGCVFGTYLLEGILRHELGFVYEYLEPRLHVLPACLIWVAAVVFCGLLITWVLKKIPLLKKIL